MAILINRFVLPAGPGFRKKGRMPKIVCRAGTLLLLLLLAVSAWPGSGCAETFRFGTVEADAETTVLDMGDIQIEDWDAFYAFLASLPCLRQADLFATVMERERIEELTARFPQITFGMSMRIREHVLRTDATVFSTLHTPKSQPHSTEELALVRFCTKLYALDLGHNDLRNLDFLYDLPELRVLIVAMNSLQDIAPVESLEHLEYLEIFNNRITDISCLSSLPYLMDLNLSGNDIADLSPVLGLSSLGRLWMNNYDRKLPARQIREEAERIRTALPECAVDELSAGVGGLWREHPHYTVIRNMFSTGVYEPFDDSPPENRPPV